MGKQRPLNAKTLFSILDCPLRRRNMPQAKPKSQQQPTSNPTALGESDPKVKQILSTLRTHWEMGREISDGNLSVKACAAKFNFNERTVRDRRTFYREYGPEEFKKFCDLRFNSSKRPLDSGYIRYLVTIKGPVKGFGDTAVEARYAFAKHAANIDLSKSQLHTLIKDKTGKSKSSHGGKFSPRDKASAIEGVARDAVKWIKRCEAAVDLGRAKAKPSQMLKSLLIEFSKWTSNAAKFCEIPKGNVKKAELLVESMRESLDGILELQSKCVATLKAQKV